MNTPITAATPGQTRTEPCAPALTKIITAELSKILSQPSQRWLVLAAIVLAPVAAVVFCVSLPVTQDATLAELSPIDVLGASVLGIDVATIATIVFAATAIGTEYSTGLIQQSLTITANRFKLLGAKIVSVALVTAVIGLASAALVAVIAGLGLSVSGRDFFDVVSSDGLQLLVGSMAMPVFYGVLAAFLVMIFRTSAAGILGALGVLVVSGILPWFGAGVSEVLTPLTPHAAIHSIAGIATDVEQIHGARATVTLLAWLGLAYAGATWRFCRKDA